MSFAILTGILSIWVSSLFFYILCEFSFINVTSRSVNFFESGLFFRQPYHSKCIIIYHVAYARNLGVIFDDFSSFALDSRSITKCLSSLPPKIYIASLHFCALFHPFPRSLLYGPCLKIQLATIGSVTDILQNKLLSKYSWKKRNLKSVSM